MVSWIEKEKLVSYDEIDSQIELLKKELIDYCSYNTEDLNDKHIIYLSGCLNSLIELKRIHTKDWEAKMPPDPIIYNAIR